MSTFTENQRRAIEMRGNVLVVAGAGTGKTRTLVSRCVEWLAEKPGEHSLDRLLMVTFTEAAAAEMRRRIRQELTQRLERQPLQTFLAEQLALLETAYISTLHSFCLQLVRQHFYELDVDPQLTVLPEDETVLLADETLSRLLEQHYGSDTRPGAAVRRLVQVQARGWDDRIKRLVRKLHEYSQTLPDPDGWLRRQRAHFGEAQPGAWKAWLPEAIQDWKERWSPRIARFAEAAPNVADCCAALALLSPTATPAEARQVIHRIGEAHKSKWPRGTKGTVCGRLKEFFTDAAFFYALLSPSLLPEEPAGSLPDQGSAIPTSGPSTVSDDPLEQDWAWVRADLATLLELTAEFSREFAAAKRDQAAVDFHDLEQLTLRLLWDEKREHPSALARAWREKLSLIFVDEYQDINAAQDAILRALAGEDECANRFLVGDPKQSIYRFRLADPHIFQEYAQRWGEDSPGGCAIALSDNFRSRESILDFVNTLFRGCMKPELGGILYDDAACLQYGDRTNRPILSRAGDERAADFLPPVEVHLRVTQKNDKEENEEEEDGEAAADELDGRSSAESEARLVALRLAELRASSAKIWDDAAGSFRAVDWRDMVILLRSPHGKAEAYAKEFARLGIPLVLARGGFFQHSEVSDLLSLLAVLDNPLQDIPLLAVLRSPMAGFTMDELALVRLAARGRFWHALQRFHRLARPGLKPSVPESGPTDARQARLGRLLADPDRQDLRQSAWAKVDQVLARIANWRRLVRESSLGQALDTILRETDYELFLIGQPRGAQRLGNVAKLLHWARRFDQVQRQGLYRFLRFVEAQREAEVDHEPASVAAENAVHLMSIHQSKGLEFQVVVVADLGKPFNLVDLKADVILDEKYGLCPLVKPPFTEQRYPSLPYRLAQRRQRLELLGEELRLLYVALTRACQGLILFGTTAGPALERWAAAEDPSDVDLAAAGNCLEWLGPWLTRASGRSNWAVEPHGKAPLFQWTFHRDEDEDVESPPLVAPRPVRPAADLASAELEEEALRKLSWQYPFLEFSQHHAKLSVSKVRAGVLAELEDDNRSAPGRYQKRRLAESLPGLDAAARGTAHHTYLQHVRLDLEWSNPAALAAEADRMENEALLTAEERACLDLPAVAAFWRSSVGVQILAHRGEIHREHSFTFRVPYRYLREFQQAESERLRRQAGQRGRTRSDCKARPGGPGELSAVSAPPSMSELPSEYLIVTGVVDLLVLSPKELWILDFKSDAVTPSECDRKAGEYYSQLHLYDLALRGIYGRAVTHCWLHFLQAGRTVECPTGGEGPAGVPGAAL